MTPEQLNESRRFAMLVLTRKRKQTIQVGEDIVITVQQIKGNAVRIGIDAPRSLPIRRGELSPLENSPLENSALENSAEVTLTPAAAHALLASLPTAPASPVAS